MNSSYIPSGESLKVDEKDLFKGINGNLSRKQKKKAVKRLMEA